MSLTRKAAVIGAGYVGSSIVNALVLKSLVNEVVLIEREDSTEKCIAQINDIRHGIPYMGSSNIYQGTYEDIRDCDLIIIASGRNRLPGESRPDLAMDNVRISKAVADEIGKHYNRGVILVVTNPVDIITHKITDWLSLPNGTVLGTGCILDSSRLTNIIADYVGLRADVVTANVIGEHGDGQIPLWSKALIAGIPIKEYCDISGLPFNSEIRIDMEEQVKRMGTEIIRGKGRTHYGIATCVCYIADAVLNRRATIASLSSTLDGEYGISGITMSLPSVVGPHGIERTITDTLSDLEYSKLKEAEKLLKASLKQVTSI